MAFLEAAISYFAKFGIRIERVMTDNGSCYQSKGFRAACKRFGLRQIFTKPYAPMTNGKVEHFIQPTLREWATPVPTRTRINDLLSYSTGSTATIGNGHMVA